MLRENFVQDEKGAWYIPDLNNAADLAKVRRKALLKEFYDSCVPGKGKLKVFRMEAIRAGFDDAGSSAILPPSYPLATPARGRIAGRPDTIEVLR